MKQHLKKSCNEQAEGWKSVIKFTHADLTTAPSAQSVQDAEKLFGFMKGSDKGEHGLLMAHLVFDSSSQVQAGVRGPGSVARQLLYKCGHICIDMQLEPNLGQRRLELIGQVFNENSPTDKLPNLPVSLLSDGDPVSNTSTNPFGEFYFGFNPVRHPQLLLAIEKGNMIVPLPEANLER